jgi:hypothetical protein
MLLAVFNRFLSVLKMFKVGGGEAEELLYQTHLSRSSTELFQVPLNLKLLYLELVVVLTTAVTLPSALESC